MNLPIDSFEDYGWSYLNRIEELLRQADIRGIAKFLKICDEARLAGKKIYFAGNGGSAATASHFAADFLGVNIKKFIEPPFQTVSLCDNAAVTLAFGNDFGYEKIFVNQLKSLFNVGDVLVVISASGNSSNVVEAVEWANLNGGITVGLVGFDGGKLQKVCSHSVLCKTEKGEYGPVEDFHMIIDHIINCFLIENA